MNIGWSGVIFVWAMLLLPIIVAATYTLWKSSVLTKQLKFFFSSIAVGYLAFVSVNVFLVLFAKAIGFANYIQAGNINGLQAQALMFLVGIVLFLSSIVSTHVLFTKKFS